MFANCTTIWLSSTIVQSLWANALCAILFKISSIFILSPTAFLCEECGKAFASARNLEIHRNSRFHSNLTIQCPSCPKKFHGTSNLKRHSERVHSVEVCVHVCEVCGKGFQSIESQKRHIGLYKWYYVKIVLFE